MHEYKQKLETIREEIDHALKAVDLGNLQKRVAELMTLTQGEGFWNNQERAQKTSKELSDLQKEIQRWEKIQKDCGELIALLPTIRVEDDAASGEEFKQMVAALEADWHKLEISTFLNGKYDQYNVILAIHAGTGGKDAHDWAEMLLRMYTRYAEKQGWSVEIFDKSMGEEVGLKSATLLISGYLAYGYLKGENGVHRLVRQSPFNAKHSRETSFAKVEILPEIPEEHMAEIKKDDLRVDTYRSGGAGGQNVNKTSSAVRITHIPSGIVVTCQDERSQLQNKERAMKVLNAKLMDLMEKQQVAEIAAIKGERVETSWGNQVRSYVLHPYTMVKDHRTEHEEHDTGSVLDGELDGFIEASLKGKR
ncbi:MAG: peptide chain release factor 2 [Candidatus Gracilibacteria bacterium]|jgi:peptide chain release factor 2